MYRRILLDRAGVRSKVISQSKRSFFYPQGGEVGISGITARNSVLSVIALTIAGFIGLKFLLFDHLSTKRQFLQDTTDLWTDDGTIMRGEEAVANLRIQHERIMPFMDEIQAKLLAASSGDDNNEEESEKVDESNNNSDNSEQSNVVSSTENDDTTEEENAQVDKILNMTLANCIWTLATSLVKSS